MAEEEEKKPKITVKGLGEVSETDYRFAITAMLTGGGLILAVIAILRDRVDAFTAIMAVFGPLIGMAVQSYFKSKE